MLRFKPEVRIGDFTDPLSTIINFACRWSAAQRVEVQVTSINDPAPGRVATSLHACDLAIDLEPVSNLIADRQALAEFFRRQLDPQFDVVFERTHVHVEWDAHRAPLRLV
jgi:hypothetical protein